MAEPKRQLEVVLDGVAHRVPEGGETVVKVGDREVKLLARVLPTRRFAAAGVTFDVPTDMSFESEDDESLRSWTFDGNNVVLTVQRFAEGDADEIAKLTIDAVREQFQGDRDPVVGKVNLGGKDFVAHCLDLSVAGNPICYRWVPIVGAKESLMLVLQDSSVLGSPTPELKNVMDLLAKTFAITAK